MAHFPEMNVQKGRVNVGGTATGASGDSEKPLVDFEVTLVSDADLGLVSQWFSLDGAARGT